MKKFLASNTLNSWKILLYGRVYAITPAHNIVYKHKNNDRLIKSNFINDNDNEWNFPVEYTKSFSPEFDIAWKHIDDKSEDVLYPQKNIGEIENTQFYFLQPRDFNGNMTNDYVLGSMTRTVYKSPNSDLYEGLNVGFRGMSGAICINPKFPNTYLGLFVRLGKNLGWNFNASTLEMHETKEITRGLIMTNKQIEKIILNYDSVELKKIIN